MAVVPADTLIIYVGDRRRVYVDVLREVIDKETGEHIFDPAKIEDLTYVCYYDGELYDSGVILRQEEHYFIWFEPNKPGSYRFTFSFKYSGETFNLKMPLIVRNGVPREGE